MVDSTVCARRWWMAFLLVAMTAGCSASDGEDEPDWQYDQADMEAAVFGTWTGTFTASGGDAVPLTLEIRSSDELTRGLSCGNRNFSNGEGTPGLGLRCLDVSSLSVSGTLVVDDGSDAEELDGTFTITGTELVYGDLWFDYRGSSLRSLQASFRDGGFTACQLRAGETGTCTLDERVE